MSPIPRSSLSALLSSRLLLSACGGGAQRRYVSPSESMAYSPPAYYDVSGPSGESYAAIQENQQISTADAPRSTFAIDVDTASMSNVRRFLEDNTLPPADAVRIEEMVNDFDYAYPDPASGPKLLEVIGMTPPGTTAGVICTVA